MSNIRADKNLKLKLSSKEDHEKIFKISRALASKERLEILTLLINKSMNIGEIARKLKLPKSSVSNHISIMEDAEILYVSTQQGNKRHLKMCSKQLNEFLIDFAEADTESKQQGFSMEIPVGLFSEANISAPCGMYVPAEKNSNHIDAKLAADNPNLFFDPRRAQAELLWFTDGYISYSVPNNFFNTTLSKLELSFELCSEIVYHKIDWPSDITLKINDIEATTFLSPGDFGGRKGKFSPHGWGIDGTQYGLLYKLVIDDSGVYLNNVLVNKKTLKDFSVVSNNNVKITFGVDKDAVHRGGLNLFGRGFGDYEQSITLTLYP
ncbi:MAG: ArsR family transcriptional regulator [Clostridia bacterium]|nr:ArsR family transcriptional regulator [Clostridia bacterium]